MMQSDVAFPLICGLLVLVVVFVGFSKWQKRRQYTQLQPPALLRLLQREDSTISTMVFAPVMLIVAFVVFNGQIDAAWEWLFPDAPPLLLFLMPLLLAFPFFNNLWQKKFNLGTATTLFVTFNSQATMRQDETWTIDMSQEMVLLEVQRVLEEMDGTIRVFDLKHNLVVGYWSKGLPWARPELSVKVVPQQFGVYKVVITSPVVLSQGGSWSIKRFVERLVIDPGQREIVPR